MSEPKELEELDDLQEVWETSAEKPVLLFKLSTTCPISAGAFKEFNTFLDSNQDNIGSYFVKVRESRPVSNQIAEDLDVQHHSPQLFLIKDRKQVWNTSHSDITVDSMKEALSDA